MKNKFKITIPLAIVITLVAVIYQRSTGPTYPRKFTISNGMTDLRIKLLRSQGGDIDAPVEIPTFSEQTTGTLSYKRFPTDDPWTTVELVRTGNQLKGSLPNQPPAGKLEYFVTLKDGNQEYNLGSASNPVIIRYKGEVPIFILAPHIFFMFFALLLATLSALESIFKTTSARTLTFITTASLVTGGMILGPIVQKYAFGVYWAGFPYDWDLTDNKLLIGVLAWLSASAFNFSRQRRPAIIAAAVILVGVYSIPHSMMGSQFNYDKGKIETDR